MDEGSRLPWLIAGVLLCCAMYFAVTEISVASVSRSRIKALADRGDKKAKNVLYILDDFDRAISTILIGTNIVHISTASVVTVAVTRRWGLSAVSVSTIITTVAVFFAGEMLPKSIAKKYSETCALGCSGVLCFLMRLFAPLSGLLAVIGEAAMKLTGGEGQKSVTEEELYDIIEDMTEEGSLNEEQGELISSALQFGDVTVESILTPRVDLVSIDADDSIDEILSVIRQCGHSRLPVYEGSVDNIIGILQIRRFIKAYLRLGRDVELKSMLDEAFFVHQSTNIDELLPVMSRRKQNMAVVTDNYGGTVGIVTVEDILEELVGEIWDEDDVIEEQVVELGDGEYRIDAEETVTDAFDRMGFEDPEEDEELVNTQMGEWVYTQFPSIPAVGDSFSYYGLSVTVSAMEHNRILSLVAKLPRTDEEGGDGE